LGLTVKEGVDLPLKQVAVLLGPPELLSDAVK
jgi:hypothetical protein